MCHIKIGIRKQWFSISEMCVPDKADSSVYMNIKWTKLLTSCFLLSVGACFAPLLVPEIHSGVSIWDFLFELLIRFLQKNRKKNLIFHHNILCAVLPENASGFSLLFWCFFLDSCRNLFWKSLKNLCNSIGIANGLLFTRIRPEIPPQFSLGITFWISEIPAAISRIISGEILGRFPARIPADIFYCKCWRNSWRNSCGIHRKNSEHFQNNS